MPEAEAAEVPDVIRKMLLERAADTLGYVRAVKWGEAMTNYTVVDSDLALDITIRISCTRKA